MLYSNLEELDSASPDLRVKKRKNPLEVGFAWGPDPEFGIQRGLKEGLH